MRPWWKRLVLLAILAGSAGAAWSQSDYPTKPIRVLVPFAAGGALDAIARPLSESFQRVTGQPWIIENIGGAGGTIAAAQIARAQPDGYQLLMASNSQISVAPYAYPKLAYDPEHDFVPVIHLSDSSAVLYASSESPFRTLKDVVDRAKAAPGSINFAHTGNGSVSHLAMELFAQQAGVKFASIPYKGAGVALPDLAGGQVSLLFTFVSSAKPVVEGGHIRPIAVAAEKRLESLPEVPTFAELGYPKIVAKLWIGLMAPRGTPPAVVQKLATTVGDLLREPAMARRFPPLGMEIGGGDTSDFQRLIANDTARWRELSRAVDLTAR